VFRDFKFESWPLPWPLCPRPFVTKIELLTGFELRDDHSVAASRYACGVRDLAN
jgi:hypothetical protein